MTIHKCDTSEYIKREAKVPPIGKNKVIGLMKDELSGKIITEFVALRTKLYAYKQLDREKPEDKGWKEVCSEEDIDISTISNPGHWCLVFTSTLFSMLLWTWDKVTLYLLRGFTFTLYIV